jgi:hypothetical protein
MARARHWCALDGDVAAAVVDVPAMQGVAHVHSLVPRSELDRGLHPIVALEHSHPGHTTTIQLEDLPEHNLCHWINYVAHGDMDDAAHGHLVLGRPCLEHLLGIHVGTASGEIFLGSVEDWEPFWGEN